jgi:hypothetical protein
MQAAFTSWPADHLLETALSDWMRANVYTALQTSVYVDIEIQRFVSSMEQVQQCEQEMNQIFTQWIQHVQRWTLRSDQNLDAAEGIVSSIGYLRQHLENLLMQLDAIQFTDQYDPARDRRRHIVQQIDGFLARNALWFDASWWSALSSAWHCLADFQQQEHGQSCLTSTDPTECFATINFWKRWLVMLCKL